MASKCPKCDKTVYFGECWAGPASAALRGQPPAAEPRAPPRDARPRDARPRARPGALPTRVWPEGGAGRGGGSHARTPQWPVGPSGSAWSSSQDEAGLWGGLRGSQSTGAERGGVGVGRAHSLGASRALLPLTDLPVDTWLAPSSDHPATCTSTSAHTGPGSDTGSVWTRSHGGDLGLPTPACPNVLPPLARVPSGLCCG